MTSFTIHPSQWYREHIPGFPQKATVARSTTLGIVNVLQREYSYSPERRRGTETATMVGKVVDNEKYYPIAEYNRRYKRGGRLRTIPKVKEIQGIGTYDEIEEKVIKGLKRLSLGATPIFVETARAIGIVEDLKAAGYEEATISVLLSIACHWLSAKTNVFRQYADWASNRHLPFGEKLTAKALGEFAYQIGEDSEKMNAFFAKRIQRAGETEVLYVDSTRISTSAENIEERAKGLTKQKTIEDQVGSVVLLGRKSQQPLSMRLFAGDVPDVSTIDDMLNRINECVDRGWQSTFVADKGYNSIENQAKILEDGKHFLMACKTNFGYVRNAFKEAAKYMDDPNRNLDEQGVIRGYRINQEFTCNGKTYTHYIYVYFDRQAAQLSLGAFFEKLNRFINAYNPDDALYKKHELNKFVELVKDDDGKTVVRMNADAVAAETRYYGYFADAASWDMDITEAYTIYKERQCIENFFKTAKQYINFGVARSHTTIALNGRHFIAFIAMAIAMRIMAKLAENQAVVDKTNELKPDDKDSKGESAKVQDTQKDEATKKGDEPQKRKRGRPALKAKLAQRTVFFSDVVNSMQSITLMYSTATGRSWVSEVTERQHRMAELCGVPNAYKNFHTYESGKI